MKSKLLLLLAALFIGHSDAYAQSAPKAAAVKESSVTLSSGNLIVLNEAIMPETMGKVILKAKELDAALKANLSNRAREVASGKKTPLYVFVNSPGGSIQTGLEMMESLKGLGRPVHSITLFAASMAWQLVQNLDERYILRNGVMMSHQAYGGFEGTFGGGGGQIDARYGLWMDRINEMDQKTVDRTKGKQTLESYRKAYSQELWRTGARSVNDGYSDSVATVSCDESLNGVNSTVLNVSFMGIPIEVSYDLDKCPTNTNPMNLKISIQTTKGKMTIPVFQSKGGEFGQACLTAAATNKEKLCASDATLDLNRINDAVERFKAQGMFDSTKQRPIPMRW